MRTLMASKLLLTFFCCIFLIGSAFALEPVRPNQENYITRAAYVDNKLWVLSDAGELFTIASDSEAPARIELPLPAHDICKVGSQLYVLTGLRENPASWTLLKRDKAAWVNTAVIERQSDYALALVCNEKDVSLLTSSRLVILDGLTQKTLPLVGKLGKGSLRATLGAEKSLYIGFNAGEWGGGMQNIDKHSGVIRNIEDNQSGEVCGGPLNTSCDPVNGIVQIPWKKECIAAAIGLHHMSSRGRVVSICDAKVDVLLSLVKQQQPDDIPDNIAFFGLYTHKEQLWAVANEGIFIIDKNVQPKFMPMPQYKSVGQMQVNFEMPDFVIVKTAIASRKSLGGSVPIFVPKQ